MTIGTSAIWGAKLSRSPLYDISVSWIKLKKPAVPIVTLWTDYQLVPVLFDAERFGIKVVPSPRHADILLFTGAVTRAMRSPALRAWQSAPDPKICISYGACGNSGGIFHDLYCVWGGSLIIGHAFWREFDPSRGALEKLGAKLMFQCLYLARNTSFWQSKEIRRAGKTFQLRDFDEQLHCVNFIHFFDRLLFTAKQ